MENNNLSLYLEEAEKERAVKNLSNYIKREKLRIKKVKKIKSIIKVLIVMLLALLIYLIWRVWLWKIKD